MNIESRVEDRPDPLADELDDRLEVELLGERLADLVDDRELGGALVRLGQQPLRLVEQPRVLEGDAHARRRASPSNRSSALGERVLAPMLVEDDDADHPVAGQDRDAQPRLGAQRRSSIAPSAIRSSAACRCAAVGRSVDHRAMSGPCRAAIGSRLDALALVDARTGTDRSASRRRRARCTSIRVANIVARPARRRAR